MISFLFETCSFTNNPNFIRFKWKLKRKHSLAKYVICETGIRRVEVRPKASLLLPCRTHFFLLTTMILFSFIRTSVRFISLLFPSFPLFPCPPPPPANYIFSFFPFRTFSSVNIAFVQKTF